MPVPLTLSGTQLRAVFALNPAIRDLDPQAILGADLIVRGRWESTQPVAIKLFADRIIFDNERTALATLTDSGFVPAMLAWGASGEPFTLVTSTNGVEHATALRYWICREWIAAADRPRLPIANPDRFSHQLRRFVEACTNARLLMQDGKIENFYWDGDRLVWLDLGWFSTSEATSDAAAVTSHNHAFHRDLLEDLGW